jgi:hypothetical protein
MEIGMPSRSRAFAVRALPALLVAALLAAQGSLAGADQRPAAPLPEHRLVTALTPPPNPLPISGTWAIKQVVTASDASGDFLLFGATGALRTPGLRGFGARIPWKSMDHDSTVLDASLAVANGQNLPHGVAPMTPVAFSPRLVTGSWTPQSYFDAGGPFFTAASVTPNDPSCPGNVCTVPTPFMSDGSPNTIFEGMYDSEVSFLADWCRTHGIRLLHLPWYGVDYAELNNGAEVQALPGYSYESWLVAHERLVDIAFRYAGPDLAIEFPLSGYGPLVNADTDLANYIAARSGGNTGSVFVQANGLGPQTFGISDWGTTDGTIEGLKDAASWPKPIGHGEQMIDQGEYAWDAIYSDLLTNGARYVEVYSFTIANPAASPLNHTLLLSKILSFATASAQGFTLSVPGTIAAGTSFSFTVTASDPAYVGTIHLTSTDNQSCTNFGLPKDYTFKLADSGVHVFNGPNNRVTLKTVGNRVLMATDTASSGISGYSPVIPVTGTSVTTNPPPRCGIDQSGTDPNPPPRGPVQFPTSSPNTPVPARSPVVQNPARRTIAAPAATVPAPAAPTVAPSVELPPAAPPPASIRPATAARHPQRGWLAALAAAVAWLLRFL